MDKHYGCKRDDGSSVHFFALNLSGDRHALNFPYLVSVVASLRSTQREQRRPTVIAIVSIAIAVIALAISIYGTFVARLPSN